MLYPPDIVDNCWYDNKLPINDEFTAIIGFLDCVEYCFIL